MRIDSYNVGVMKVEGAEYRSDLIILGETIKPNWWRKDGHSLAAQDIAEILEFQPEVLVVGKGASAMMRVPAATEKILQEEGIELIAVDTGRAVKQFNELAAKGKKVAGVFHLTC
ncbi:MAG: Mth938-like domain-containing protein [Planctomycetota bacterium]